MKSRVLRSSTGSLRVGGEELPYRVEWRRVKYPRLEFKSGELLVILPPTCESEGPLLEEKKAWVLEKHRLIKEGLEGAGGGLRLFGEPIRVREGGGLTLDLEKGELVYNPGDEIHLERLRGMLRRRLEERIRGRVEELGGITGLRPSRICIRRQRSKWASCSSSGTLSFNLRMVSLPPRLIDYVVLHELLHLKHPRHDREFWGEVGRFFPDYRDLERELLRYWFSTERWGAWLFGPKASQARAQNPGSGVP